jgi:hypothetical protein
MLAISDAMRADMMEHCSTMPVTVSGDMVTIVTSSGASARTSAVLLQLLTAAHVRGAAQATAQPEDDVVGERVVAPEGALQSAADRLLYTQEAIDEIDAALEWAGLELAAEDGGSPDLAGLAAVEDLADALIAAEEEDAV